MSIDLSKGAFHALGGTTEEGQFPSTYPPYASLCF